MYKYQYILYIYIYIYTVLVHAKSLSCVPLFATPWTVVCQDLLCMAFSRQEYWSVLPCPSPGDLTDTRSNPRLMWLLYCRQIPCH